MGYSYLRHHYSGGCENASPSRLYNNFHRTYSCDSVWSGYSCCAPRQFHCHGGGRMGFWGAFRTGLAWNLSSLATGFFGGVLGGLINGDSNDSNNSWFNNGVTGMLSPYQKLLGNFTQRTLNTPTNTRSEATPTGTNNKTGATTSCGTDCECKNPGNKDTDTLADFNKRFTAIKNGTANGDTLEALKANINAKIETPSDDVQNESDIINYRMLLGNISDYENSKSKKTTEPEAGPGTSAQASAQPVVGTSAQAQTSGSQVATDGALATLASATYGTINSKLYLDGYTDAKEEDLSMLSPSNVKRAHDVEGKKNKGIGDVVGNEVTIENDGKIIKLKDQALNSVVTYQLQGITESGQLIYKDTSTKNGEQYYLLQKDNQGYHLIQYKGMKGADNKAHP